MQSDEPIVAQTVLDSVADGVFTVDREWRITSFNRAAERITGIQPGRGDRRPVLRRFSSQHLRFRVCTALHRELG